jgi:hypothetical protein
MKGSECVQIHNLLPSSIIREESLATSPGRLIPEEIAHGTYWIRGCVDPRASLDDAVN